jgi:glycosyltransferase involved in cell wall biosynthesis
LSAAAVYADAVIALDDGSTDDTRRILDADPLVKIVLTNPVRTSYRGWDDAANRNRLLGAASALDPEWVLFLDADETIPSDDGEALRTFLDGDAIPGLAYGLLHHRMWRDADYEPTTHWIYRLFAWRQGMRMPPKRLHFNPVPDTIPDVRWIRTTIRVQHFGVASHGQLVARRLKYQEADPEGQYGSDRAGLNDPPTGVLPWASRPPDLPVLWRVGDRSAGNVGAVVT